MFTAPLRRFLEAGPGYSHRDVEWQSGLPYRLHYFDHPDCDRSFCIWGLTAGMLVVIAERAFGRPPAFQPNPPGAPPYTALAYEGGRLVLRHEPAAQDALGLAGAASAGEGPLPSSAAVAGAVVTDSEAAAATGGDDGSSEGGS